MQSSLRKALISGFLLWHLTAYLKPTLCLMAGLPNRGICRRGTVLDGYAKLFYIDQTYNFYSRSPTVVPLVGYWVGKSSSGAWLTGDSGISSMQHLRHLSFARVMAQDSLLARDVARFYCRRSGEQAIKLAKVSHVVLPYERASAWRDGNGDDLYQAPEILIDGPCAELMAARMDQDPARPRVE